MIYIKKHEHNAALTAGIIWGMTLWVMTIAYVYFGYGKAFLEMVASIYPGYTLTLGGSVVGLVYGFLDASIGIYIIGWVYRKIAGKK